MNVFVAKNELPPVSKLFRKHVRHLIDWFHNLKIGDVDTPERYDKTLSFIKSAILLQPIMFGRPGFSGDAEHRESSFLGTFKGTFRNIFIRRISFPFTGSRELFYYAFPEDGIDPQAAILMPAEKSLDFTLNSVFYSRSAALKAVRDILRPTLQMIAGNNTLVAAWSDKLEKRIEGRLKNYQTEFLELYDPNGLLMLLNR